MGRVVVSWDSAGFKAAADRLQVFLSASTNEKFRRANAYEALTQALGLAKNWNTLKAQLEAGQQGGETAVAQSSSSLRNRAHLAGMDYDALVRSEWRFIHKSLVQAKEYIEQRDGGANHTWINPAIDIAAARAAGDDDDEAKLIGQMRREVDILHDHLFAMQHYAAKAGDGTLMKLIKAALEGAAVGSIADVLDMGSIAVSASSGTTMLSAATKPTAEAVEIRELRHALDDLAGTGHLLMVGPTGCGKTFTTNRLVAAAVRAGRSALVLDDYFDSSGLVPALGGQWVASLEGQPFIHGSPGLQVLDLAPVEDDMRSMARQVMAAVDAFVGMTALPSPRLVVMPTNLKRLLGLDEFFLWYCRIHMEARKQGVAVVSHLQNRFSLHSAPFRLDQHLRGNFTHVVFFSTDGLNGDLDHLGLSDIETAVLADEHPATANLGRWAMWCSAKSSEPVVLWLDELGGFEPPLGALQGGRLKHEGALS